MIRVVRHERGPRVYVVSIRVHHGTGGLLLAGAALLARRRRLAVALALWAATDWRDFPFTDHHNH